MLNKQNKQTAPWRGALGSYSAPYSALTQREGGTPTVQNTGRRRETPNEGHRTQAGRVPGAAASVAIALTI